MEPQYLLTQQIQATAVAIEENLRCLYDYDVPDEHKRVAIQYVYVQARQINELVNSLFVQFRHLEGQVNHF